MNNVSFNFVQYVCGPTHNRGHTLHLVFTLRVEISFINNLDKTISEHKCIVFSCEPRAIERISPRSSCTRIFNGVSAPKFCAIFDGHYLCTNDLAEHFNSICLFSLDIIPPLKIRTKSSEKKPPWIKKNICSS